MDARFLIISIVYWSCLADVTPSTSVDTTRAQAPGKVLTTLQSKVLSQVNSVFAEDEPEEEDPHHVIKKKIKPFEITAQVNNFSSFINFVLGSNWVNDCWRKKTDG